jgi:hypothetical protein
MWKEPGKYRAFQGAQLGLLGFFAEEKACFFDNEDNNVATIYYDALQESFYCLVKSDPSDIQNSIYIKIGPDKSIERLKISASIKIHSLGHNVDPKKIFKK